MQTAKLAIVSACMGIAGGWVAATAFKLNSAGPTLLINSDTVGAAIGAALTIGGTIGLATFLEREKQRAEHNAHAKLLWHLFNLVHITASRPSYNPDREVHVSHEQEAIRRHARLMLDRYDRANRVLVETLPRLSALSPKELNAANSVQIMFATLRKEIEYQVNILNDSTADRELIGREIQQTERALLMRIEEEMQPLKDRAFS